MIKKILLLILIILALVVFLGKRRVIKISQNITQAGYNVSITHTNKYTSDIADGSFALGYIGGIGIFLDSEKDVSFIDFDYKLQNNGDDTLAEVSETGAPPFPPQPEELIYPLTDKYERVGEWLGYNLYIEKEITEFGGVVYQEVYPGQLTDHMTLLSKDKSRVNYYDRLIVRYSSDRINGDMKQYKKDRKEFLKILKSMKITPIKKPE